MQQRNSQERPIRPRVIISNFSEYIAYVKTNFHTFDTDNQQQILSLLDGNPFGHWWEGREISFLDVAIPTITTKEAVEIFTIAIPHPLLREKLWEKSQILKEYYLKPVIKDKTLSYKFHLSALVKLINSSAYDIAYQIWKNNVDSQNATRCLSYKNYLNLLKNVLQHTPSSEHPLFLEFMRTISDIGILNELVTFNNALSKNDMDLRKKINSFLTSLILQQNIIKFSKKFNFFTTDSARDFFQANKEFARWWINGGSSDKILKLFNHFIKLPYPNKAGLLILWNHNPELRNYFYNDPTQSSDIIMSNFINLLLSGCEEIISDVWENSNRLRETIKSLSNEEAIKLLSAVFSSNTEDKITSFTKEFINQFPNDSVIFNVLRQFLLNPTAPTSKKGQEFIAALKQRWLKREENPVSTLYLERERCQNALATTNIEDIQNVFFRDNPAFSYWWRGSDPFLTTEEERKAWLQACLKWLLDVCEQNREVTYFLWQSNTTLRDFIIYGNLFEINESNYIFFLKGFSSFLLKNPLISNDIWENSRYLFTAIANLKGDQSTNFLREVLDSVKNDENLSSFIESFITQFPHVDALKEILNMESDNYHSSLIDLLKNRLFELDIMEDTLFNSLKPTYAFLENNEGDCSNTSPASASPLLTKQSSNDQQISLIQFHLFNQREEEHRKFEKKEAKQAEKRKREEILKNATPGRALKMEF